MAGAPPPPMCVLGWGNSMCGRGLRRKVANMMKPEQPEVASRRRRSQLTWRTNVALGGRGGHERDVLHDVVVEVRAQQAVVAFHFVQHRVVAALSAERRQPTDRLRCTVGTAAYLISLVSIAK